MCTLASARENVKCALLLLLEKTNNVKYNNGYQYTLFVDVTKALQAR